MRIDNDGWDKLQHRLSTRQAGPPTAVYLLVHTLSGGAEIQDGYAESKSDESSTTWRHWLITSSSLIYTEVEFAEPNWDGPNEDHARQMDPNSHVEPIVKTAWIRPFDSVISMAVGAVGRLVGRGFQRDWYAVDGLTLTFADGSVVQLPGQINGPHDSREDSDRFLASVRGRLAF